VPAAPAAGSSLFGFGAAIPAASVDASKKPATGGSLFGAAPAAAAASSSTPIVQPSAGSSGLSKGSQPAKTVTLGEQAPSFVKGKTFNEIVERFEQELGTQVKTFKDQAAEVREWDLVLMQNAQSVSTPIHATQASS
jgi:nuclear pore complex protein Nup62